MIILRNQHIVEQIEVGCALKSDFIISKNKTNKKRVTVPMKPSSGAM